MNVRASVLKTFPQDPGQWLEGRVVFVVGAGVALVGFGLFIGNMIGHGAWLYLGLVSVAIPAILWPIEAAVGLYAFMIPFDSVTALGDAKTGTTLNLLVGGMAGAALLGTGLMRHRLRWPSRSAWLWLLFLGWNALTIVWALQPDFALHELLTPISLVLLYLAAVSWPVSEKQLSWLTRATIAGGCVASWMAIYLFSSGVSYLSWTSRASLVVAGRETNPDRFAAELLLPLALVAAELLSARSWWGKMLAGLVSASICYTIFITMSRASLVAIGVMLLVFAVRIGINRRMLIFGFILACLVSLMPSTFFLRLRDMIASGGDGRFDIWAVGWAAWKKYGLWGAGFANFPIAYQDFAGVSRIFRGYSRASHNAFLQTAVELGIVGMLLLAYALYSHFSEFRRLRLAEPSAPKTRLSLLLVGLEAAGWAMMAFGFFADILWEKTFWLTLMLSLMAIGTSRALPAVRRRGVAANGITQ
jgi:O-Antigen ligase